MDGVRRFDLPAAADDDGDGPGTRGYRSRRSAAGRLSGRQRTYDPTPATATAPAAARRARRRLRRPVARRPRPRPARPSTSVWEIVLLLGVAGVGLPALAPRRRPPARRARLDTLLVIGGRARPARPRRRADPARRRGQPGARPDRLAAALHFAENGDRGLRRRAGPAAGRRRRRRPGRRARWWSASTCPAGRRASAAALGVIVYDQQRTAPVDVQGDYDPTDHALYLFGGFAAGRRARRRCSAPSSRSGARSAGSGRSATRPAAAARSPPRSPASSRWSRSSVLAAVAGVLLAAAGTGPVVPGHRPGVDRRSRSARRCSAAPARTAGAAGSSAPLLAVGLITLFLRLPARARLGHRRCSRSRPARSAVGLVVTRLVETFGRPLPASRRRRTGRGRGRRHGTATWTPDLPEHLDRRRLPAQNRSDRWDDGPWGTEPVSATGRGRRYARTS